MVEKINLKKLSQRKTFLWYHSGFLLTFSYMYILNVEALLQF